MPKGDESVIGLGYRYLFAFVCSFALFIHSANVDYTCEPTCKIEIHRKQAPTPIAILYLLIFAALLGINLDSLAKSFGEMITGKKYNKDDNTSNSTNIKDKKDDNVNK